MGSAFLKDFLRDVGGTLWGTAARAAGSAARAAAGGTGAGRRNCRNSLSYPVRTLIKLRLVREKKDEILAKSDRDLFLITDVPTDQQPTTQ